MKSKREKLTQARLKELLDYDPETGMFTRKLTTSNRAKSGDVAGSVTSEGYLRISVDWQQHLAHRLAFLWMDGYFPENDVDHIDRVRHNNKWTNLREVSRQCNLRNCKVRETNKSGITGVGWYKRDKKWRATIKANGKLLHLGFFKTKTEAAKARWNAEVKYGFPNCNTTSSAFQYIQQRRQK